MSSATIRRLIWSALLDLKGYFGDAPPKGYRDVVDAWEKIGLFATDKK